MLRTVTVGCLATFLAAAAPADRAALGIAPAPIALHNLSYVDAGGGRAEATFIDPPGAAPHPAVLFVHWLDPQSTSNGRTQFLPDGLALARAGIASLHIDTPWSDPTSFQTRDRREEMAMTRTMLTRLTRALDVLSALDHVDPARLAYVGHDFGAMYGTALAARDRRPVAWVYIAGTDRFAEWFTLGQTLDPAARQRVFDAFRSLDPVETLGAVAPAPLLLQFADKDPFVTRQAADALIAAGRKTGHAIFYDCGHEMNRQAMDDRVAWLAGKLGGK